MKSAPSRRPRAEKYLNQLDSGEPLTRTKFDVDEAEHFTRGRIVAAVFGLVVFELIALIAAWLFCRQSIAVVKDMAAIILAPTFTLFGTIVGFYFSRAR